MAKRKSTLQQFVLTYLQELDIAPSRTSRQFLDELARRHGHDVASRLHQIMSDRDAGVMGEDLYAFKNQNLRLSLDFARFSADLYRRFFDWVANWKPVERDCRAILDVGCDNGIVTCFLARLFPGARVIGVDRCPEAIHCAILLAEQLHINNVAFVCSDFEVGIDECLNALKMPVAKEDMSAKDAWTTEAITEQKFDLVTSLRSLHELVLASFPWRYWSLDDLAQQLTRQTKVLSTHRYSSILDGVMSLLTPNHGQFLHAERFPHAGMILEWVAAMNLSEFSIDWKSCDWLTFHEVGEEQRIPVFIAMPQSGMDDYGLVSKVYSFLGAGGSVALTKGDMLTDVEAEWALNRTEDKTLMYGLELTYRETGARQRFELWAWHDLYIAYESSDMGFRKLTVLGTEDFLDVDAEFERLAVAHATVGECFTYQQPRA